MQQARPRSAGGARRVTIVQVAELAGVSPSTASNAITGRRPVDAQTRIRVEKAALELGYRPNLSARRLRSGGAATFAIFSSMPFAVSAGPSRLGFMMEIAAAASLAAMEQGVALMLVPPIAGADLSRLDLDIDGALVIEPSRDDPTLAALAARGVPTVAIGRVPGGMAGIEEVDLQSEATAELLVAHLAGRCARMALVVGDADRTSYASAEAAYRNHARRSGSEPVVLRLPEGGGQEGAARACAGLLASDPGIDGILALVDAFATGAVQAARSLGRSVPADLRIATRYNGLRAMESEPPLTAVDLRLDEVGTRAVHRLLAIAGLGAPARRRAAPSPVLVPRRSTACEAPGSTP
ncbi:LacI family transcriptional regulator [Aureimonas flava]|uniref:LacI family transcriptional regulator n=1 Tax=Aureimonas flava TaxID=2320271 RepID=A0A3A1WWQ9_9HYPH|nr:LacI family transcriptional regulator [Aureimonas flava]